MIDFLNGKVLEVTALVRGASVLGAIVMVAFAYYKVRSLVAVLVAALTAGVFLWTINNTEWWTDRVQEETDTLGRNGALVTEVDLQPVGAVVQVAQVV
ncbi:MAG TPA: hypothetical protein VGO78_26355 [Acidimicrobiales bacterium]|jgi:hypothetical protein|nr:hypothetical protein [Acidimicrobiales bacterium]